MNSKLPVFAALFYAMGGVGLGIIIGQVFHALGVVQPVWPGSVSWLSAVGILLLLMGAILPLLIRGKGKETSHSAALAPAEQPAPKPKELLLKKPVRSEALTLLATLQREARFVDMVREPLADYTDAQIGAAARDVLRDCGKVLQRMFAIEPLASEPEGTELTVPEGFDAARYRLTGNVGGAAPYRGKLTHHGWRATICEVPTWTGSESGASVIAPVEVEIG